MKFFSSAFILFLKITYMYIVVHIRIVLVIHFWSELTVYMYYLWRSKNSFPALSGATCTLKADYKLLLIFFLIQLKWPNLWKPLVQIIEISCCQNYLPGLNWDKMLSFPEAVNILNFEQHHIFWAYFSSFSVDN